MLTDKNPDCESAANALHFLSENRNLVEPEKAIAAKQSPNFFTFPFRGRPANLMREIGRPTIKNLLTPMAFCSCLK